MTILSRRALASALASLALASAAPAQTLPSEPLTFGNGRVTIGGNVSVTFSCADQPTPDTGHCADDTGFFNYANYNHSSLREIQLDVNAAVRASRHVALLADVRTENGDSPRPYALYLRVRPWTPALDIQFGRIPPTFGAYPRRSYASENPLIGYPLGYMYPTSLRPDAIPATADELLRMRGRGWLSNFTVGNLAADRGLSLANATIWDTGLQVHSARGWLELTGSVTTGSLGNPLVQDDNAGKQTAGRVAVRPFAGLVAGLSASRAPFLTQDATSSLGTDVANGDFTQTVWGTDIEYSRDYYLVRLETIASTWTLPTLATPLRALSTSIEGRYKLRPGFHVAARVEHLGFSDITGTDRTAAWEAPVTRVEIGTGYMVQRNLQLKAAFQRNVRDGGRVQDLNLIAFQLVFWL